MALMLLFSNYHKLRNGGYDELAGADGVLRPHWQRFVEAVEGLGAQELSVRWTRAQRMIRENGVTYNVYGDGGGMSRPWQLDPLPLLLAADEWERIERAIKQRAALLEQLLVDLYGPQRLLARGLVPPGLVLAHSRFLRPCHGTPVRAWLQLYAADVARRPDGTLCVVKDRTQSPSGAGYALENRIVLARTMPELFGACNAERLGSFFRTLQSTLAESAPRAAEQPRIVLLTPGAYNEAYFEHAYLARHLGYGLVEGGDLTVRDDRVWLKTLAGLQPVDVILRRLDDDYCDPLELRGDSFLGVPGLVQAVRSGNVAVANALGSGLAQSPALIPYLPRLCRELLGENLLLDSVETWWCGEWLDYVVEHLGSLVIKPAWPWPGARTIFGDKLSTAELDTLRDTIRAHPHRYVAQKQINMSTAPVLVGENVEPRHVMLRVYAASTNRGEGWSVLPGGMTRVSDEAESLLVSLQQGGGSKDTWVLTDAPATASPLPALAEHPIVLTRGGGDLPSRLADNLYWLGRYVERAEALVRLLRCVLVRLVDHSSLEQIPECQALVASLWQDVGDDLPPPLGSWDEVREQAVSLAFHPTRSGSLPNLLRSLNRTAGRVRDRLSSDVWRTLSALQQSFSEGAAIFGGSGQLNDALTMCRHLIANLAAFSGLAYENMTRGLGLRFMDGGRRLERGLHTLHLLSGLFERTTFETALLEALLEAADSSLTYRQRYLTSMQPVPVVDLLLLDDSNPRSVIFQIVSLGKHVERLPSKQAGVGMPLEQRMVLECVTSLRLADPEKLCETDSSGKRENLRALCVHLAEQLEDTSDVISQAHLALAPLPKHLGAE
jgi:uncharacterized circularly permuted ATP-grasp superfamily protein/uncharacterized alpha-E superfamily protein